MRITVQAQAKINWALDILSRREDGYHEMDMLMQKIALSDEIRFETARWTTLTVNGHLIANAGKNLIVRAANLLNEYMGEKRGVRITLSKRIPVRAGLGGGSADCAAALMALNDLWGFKLPAKTLKKLALSLGADVPYCMENDFCRVRGIGEDVQTLENAPKIPLVVACVSPGLSTQAVFSNFDEAGDSPLNVPMEKLCGRLTAGDFRAADEISGNALERAAIRLLPAVADTMERMRACGSLYTRMSGSGSAVFGVFETADKAREAAQKIEGATATETV
ncbi:MAG: 4-(cytidine 5'-diphospho)-2-C-methyl-D-erythritol kinase [Eubacteriales bacterium]|nr:4-(cytidine 5'-diphospho)-2-C-methyl-D-erythritol kinase [Clostridiales bacterium]MDY2769493.1 4-(cytidine 5'-diphospho)-2-C-methyl-D-erythritol kinase [Eubacteriales bacterium]